MQNEPPTPQRDPRWFLYDRANNPLRVTAGEFLVFGLGWATLLTVLTVLTAQEVLSFLIASAVEAGAIAAVHMRRRRRDDDREAS